jgi:2-aminobenzoate-CoA ligase
MIVARPATRRDMGTAHVDTFARDHLPARSAWPDLPLGDLRYPEQLNAAAVLLNEPSFQDRACVVGEHGTWTYAELRSRAEAVAAGLVVEGGLVAGNRVLLHGPNSPELIACWFGILLAGGVVVATMPLLRAGELAKVIAKAQVSHAIADAKVAGEVKRAAELQCLREYVAGESSFSPSRGFEAVATDAEDVAIIAFTSGTTGEPKGCVHLHRDLLATCDTFGARVLRPRQDDVFTATPPVAFTFGLGVSVLFPMRVGASTVPIGQPSLDAVVDAIERHSITTLSTAPTMYRAMLRGADLSRVASLRACVSAGEPLPAAVAEAWTERTGVRIIDGIGSTEMLHIFIGSPAEEARPGSVGRPVPGYEAVVVDETMQPVAPGVVGRLAVRGPTGCRYLDDPRQSVYVVDGWNLTGDAFRVDEDGYFWFAARNDDLIVSAGYNISPLEVEGALLQHDAVAECAVVASPDEERGHVVKAFVVVAEGVGAGDGLVGELQQHVKERIAPYKYPRRIEFVEALPRTATGKVQRAVLRKREGDVAGV